jgi:DNA-binding MarR family transcriptional regulator
MQKELRVELEAWLNLSTQRAMDEFMRFIRKRGLSVPQMNLMMYLYYHGACEMNHLVEPLQVGKSAVSQIVERMVQQGYLERSEVAGDRRTRMVQISPTAEQVILEGIAARQSWLDDPASELTAEEQELLLRALKTINQLYRKEG